MITLKLKAGLGNQLFQYAYARALALRSKTNLRIDLNWFSNIAPGDTKRVFLLDKYNLPIKDSSIQIVELPSAPKFRQILRKIKAKISRDIFGYSDLVYYPRLAKPVDTGTDIEVEGFWNTEKYFKDVENTIREELTLKETLGEGALKTEQKLNELGKTSTLILLHVRRGDYVSNADTLKHHGLSGLNYYTEAIKIMLNKLASNDTDMKPTFVLASDDMDWVKDNIITLLNGATYEILSNPSQIKDYEEIYLMSLCHHFIIANSSFSWWGAWLSTGQTAKSENLKKIVIGPKQWVVNPAIDTRDVLPDEWIRI